MALLNPSALPPDLPDDPHVTYGQWRVEELLAVGSPEWEALQKDRTRYPTWRARPEDWQPSDATEVHLGDIPSPVPPPNTSEYCLNRLLAIGGCGEVWEARQHSLDRSIVVKRLRRDLLDRHQGDEKAIQRLELAFRQEALTAGYLEHPNIVPVHDLGIDEDGHLLLVMKHVRGRPWEARLQQDWEAMQVDEYLTRHLPILINVAQAVAFAHSRGIVHRDLKPSQVMVGEFGEVLLMDWGIAMVVRDPDGQELSRRPGALGVRTQLAPCPAGTAAYMAPEQTESEPERIGPWTDIYLLGGILYELLTGTVPHPAQDSRAAFWDAAMKPVQPVREAAQGRPVPDDLEQLANRCLAFEARDRLESVEAFITVLKDHLTGAGLRRQAEPLVKQVEALLAKPGVLGYRDLAQAVNQASRAIELDPRNSVAPRLREQVRERYAREALDNQDLKLARLMLERLAPTPSREAMLEELAQREEEQRRAAERLEEAYRQAKAEQRHAEEARQRADEHRARAERLISFLLTDLEEGLREVNRLDLLGRATEEALKYFSEVGDGDRPGEMTIADLGQRALACRNIGEVLQAQGNLVEALEAFRKFETLAREMVHREQGHRTGQLFLAQSLERIGTILYYQGELNASLEAHREAEEAARIVAEAHPKDLEVQTEYAKSLHLRGCVHWRRAELEEAFELHKKALILYERLHTMHPNDRPVLGGLAHCLATFGNVYRDRREMPEAVSSTIRSIHLRERLLEEEPDNRTRLDDLCWSTTNLGLIQEFTGEFEDALTAFRRSLMWRTRLSEGDPSNARHQDMKGFILCSIGRLLYGFNRLDEARITLEEACSISQDVLWKDPSNLRALGSHAFSQAHLGQVLVDLNQLEAAGTHASDSLPAAEAALEKQPHNGVFQNATCQSLLLRGRLHRRRGAAAQALADWNRALDLLKTTDWAETIPQGVGLRAELLARIGRREEALEAFQVLRKRSWMLPRYERLARQLVGDAENTALELS